MTSKTHNIGAVAALLTVYAILDQPNLNLVTVLLALIATVFGSMLPDIDQSSNRLWSMLPVGNVLGKMLRRIFLGHRTLSHSLVGLIVLFQINSWISPQIFNESIINIQVVTTALLTGYISHLVLDGLTEEGLPLLFPFKINFGFPPIKWMRIKTGKWFENWVVFPIIFVFLILVCLYLIVF